MAARIVLFGATGYTGRLAAEAMVERGLRPVLAARSQDKLDALAEELGGGFETATADVADPPSVRALVDSGDVLVTTVGPFARWGGPAAAAATTAGAHYIDSTGEPPFIREVFERYGPAAEQAGIGMLTAFGYDWVPGNLAGGLALERAGELATRVDIGYFITGSGASMSGGTKASLVGAISEPAFWLPRRTHPDRAWREAGAQLPSRPQAASRLSRWAARSTSRCREWRPACVT